MMPAPGRMFVVGRVLDPRGKTGAGRDGRGSCAEPGARACALPVAMRQVPIGDARADGSGRFRIDAPRTSSSRHESFGAVALAPGYGVGWVELDPDDDQPTADISLRPEQVIHGRLFDLQGRPVPDVTLSVASIRRDLPQARPAGARSRFDGVFYWWRRDANDFPAWPRPVTTDAEGRFTLRGVGRDLHASLTVHHPRFALQTIEVETDGASESKPMTAALAPAQIVNVRVTYADTGKPVPHAPLEVMASRGRVAMVDESETDAEGRSRVNSWPADRAYSFTAYPPEGQPYLIASGRVEWPKGALEQSLDLALPRGVLIHGKVTEEGSGKPVPGATVDFVARAERQNGQSEQHPRRDRIRRLVSTRGRCPARVTSSSGAPATITCSRRSAIGWSSKASRAAAGSTRTPTPSLDLKPGIDSQEVNLVAPPRRDGERPGRRAGWPARPGCLDLQPGHPRSEHEGRGRSGPAAIHGKVRDGRFEIHGLDPDAEVPVYFLDPKRKLGGVVNLSGKSAAGGPVTVRLEPCGAARARLVDPDGKPSRDARSAT